MIDEHQLTRLLRDVAETVEVPEDGPARVLAARDASATPRPVWSKRGIDGAPGSGHPSSKRRFGTPTRGRAWPVIAGVGLALCVLLAVGVAGIGGHRQSADKGGQTRQASSAEQPGAAKGSAAASGPPRGALPQTTAPNGAPTGAAPSAGAPLSPAAPGPVPGVQTKVIKTGQVSLVVKPGGVGPAIDQLTVLVAGFGGYVEATKTSDSGASPTGDVTLRVPVNQFEALLNEVRGLGRPVSVTTSGQDVTAEYVDLGARLQALIATRAQYLQILARAQNIGDILAVQQQLSGLQTQIEQLQGQQKVLDGRTSFASLTAEVSEVARTTSTPPPSGLSEAWAHARRSFTHGLESVVSASGGLGVFFLCVLVLAGAGRLAWSVLRRRLV